MTMTHNTMDTVSKPWIKHSASFGPEKTRLKPSANIFRSQTLKRPPNKPNVGDQIESIELDRIVRTEANDNKQRRTLLVHRHSENESWGFTLQSYGLRKKHCREIDLLTYVDNVAIAGPAHRAGMRQGDVILSIDGENMEEYSHRDLISYIRQCGTRMRMVVLFENCVRKVELHTRYLKLQRLLTAKEMEFRSLEMREKKILNNEPDPCGVSLVSFSGSGWNDNMSFLSLRPELDLCPTTPIHPNHPKNPKNRLASASALSLQYSPSVLSTRSETCRGTAGKHNNNKDNAAWGSSNTLVPSATGSVGNLQGMVGTENGYIASPLLSSVGRQRFEYSHSSLPSSVRLKVTAGVEGGQKRSLRHHSDRPYSMYNSSTPNSLHPPSFTAGSGNGNNKRPGAQGFKSRPRSLAVSAISEDGLYVTTSDMEDMDNDSVLGSASDVSDVNNINGDGRNGVQNNAYMMSTPVVAPYLPPTPKMEESSNEGDADYRLPPPGMTPKFLHNSSRSPSAASTSHQSSSSASASSSMSLNSSSKSSSKSSTSSLPSPGSATSSSKPAKVHKTLVKPKHVPTQFKQPAYAIVEKMQETPGEPVLLKFKSLKNDFSFVPSTPSYMSNSRSNPVLSGSIEFGSEDMDEEDGNSEEGGGFYSDPPKQGSSFQTPTHITWNPCFHDGAESDASRSRNYSGLSSSELSLSSPLTPMTDQVFIENEDHNAAMDQLGAGFNQFSLQDTQQDSDDSGRSSSESGLNLVATCSLSDSDDSDSDTLEQEDDLDNSLHNKAVKILNDAKERIEANKRRFSGVTLEHVNENNESTDL